jgi:hypothetical protein
VVVIGVTGGAGAGAGAPGTQGPITTASAVTRIPTEEPSLHLPFLSNSHTPLVPHYTIFPVVTQLNAVLPGGGAWMQVADGVAVTH